MIVQGKVTYVAGGWPGERYVGETTLSVNVEELDAEDEIRQILIKRAKQNIAQSMCMQPHQINITNVEIE